MNSRSVMDNCCDEETGTRKKERWNRNSREGRKESEMEQSGKSRQQSIKNPFVLMLYLFHSKYFGYGTFFHLLYLKCDNSP